MKETRKPGDFLQQSKKKRTQNHQCLQGVYHHFQPQAHFSFDRKQAPGYFVAVAATGDDWQKKNRS